MPRVLVGSDGWYSWSFPEGPGLGTGLFVSILDPWKMLDNRVADTRVLFCPSSYRTGLSWSQVSVLQKASSGGQQLRWVTLQLSCIGLGARVYSEVFAGKLGATL